MVLELKSRHHDQGFLLSSSARSLGHAQYYPNLRLSRLWLASYSALDILSASYQGSAGLLYPSLPSAAEKAVSEQHIKSLST